MMAPVETGAERERLIEAFIEAVAERGYRAVSLADVFARGDVDPRVFHRHFSGKEEAFRAAWEFIHERFLPTALAAASAEDRWRERMLAVGGAVFGYLRANPDHARILYVEGPRAGGVARPLVDRDVGVYAELIDGGRRELDDPESLTRATAEGLAGALYEQVSLHLARGTVDSLPRLFPQLMFTIVRPYLGYEAALEELRR